MPTWKEYRLGEIADVNKSNINKEYPFSSIEYIDTASVTENKFEKPQIFDLNEAPSRAKRLIKVGDTLISTVRPIQKHFGFVKSAKPNTIASTGFAVVSPKSIDPKFLYYFLTQEEITIYLNTIAESGTTTFPAFRAEELNNLVIYAPEEIKDQTAIAEILSSLDDKIELNNQINKELEELAQALFKQWFIDFEFPNENGQPYKSSGGEMIESELGEIPKGWSIKKLKDILTIKRGGSPRPIQDYMTTNGLPWVKISDATAINTPYLFSTKEFIKPEGLNKTVLLKKGSLILSNSATPGLPKFLELDACIHDGWLHFQDIKELSYNYLYLLFLSIRENLVGQGNGSIFINLKTDILKDYKIVIPPNGLRVEFDTISEAILGQIKQSASEIIELQRLRDLILPKLISGELEVSEALTELKV